jgi:hypothetical protein
LRAALAAVLAAIVNEPKESEKSRI